MHVCTYLRMYVCTYVHVCTQTGSTKRENLPKKKCRNPGLNQGPLDLQSNALPTELFRQIQLSVLIIL